MTMSPMRGVLAQAPGDAAEHQRATAQTLDHERGGDGGPDLAYAGGGDDDIAAVEPASACLETPTGQGSRVTEPARPAAPAPAATRTGCRSVPLVPVIG